MQPFIAGHCSYCLHGNLAQCTNRTETGVLKRDGGFAEYITFPASHLHRIESIPFDEAALIEPTAIAMYAVMTGKAGPFDNVLVCGAGARWACRLRRSPKRCSGPNA